MAFTFNGIGTSFCFARGSGDTGGDALECFVFAYMPIVPLRAVHLYGESGGFVGSKFQSVPLKSSGSLILRVYLKYWMLTPLVIGAILAGLNTWRLCRDGTTSGNDGPLAIGWAMTIFCLFLYFILWRTDRRNRQIRRLMGSHEFGTSDPAMWDRSVLSAVRPSRELFGTETFMAAVPVLLEQRDHRGAMWAARLAAALEVAETAERLTDEVLLAHRGGGPACGS
jgi:hypothetical protein